MSLSIIMEEPSGFQEGDLEFIGRVPRSPRLPHTYSGKGRDQARGRYGSTTGRYIRAAAGRSLGGLRPHSHLSYSPNAPDTGPSRRNQEPRVVTFIRNPRHPKNLYDTEKSMRQFLKREPKLSGDMSFPDPKKRGVFRNPMAPRFHHEYDPTEEDFQISRNPLAGLGMGMLRPMPGTYRDNPGYDDTGDNGPDDDSNEQSSVSEEAESELVEGNEDGDDASVNEPPRGNGAIYSSVNKRLAPRPSADRILSEPPAFAPEPPPLPVQPVVIPRAVAGQDEPTTSYPQQQETWEESKGVKTPPMEPLHTLAEEDEDQQEIEPIEIDESQEMILRDMSTQTNVTVQNVEEQEQQDEETEERFVQIQEGREDTSTMTHENWEAVAPWSERSSGPLTRSESLAVNYRRVVAELIDADRPGEPPQARAVPPQAEPPRRQELERRQLRPDHPPSSQGDPPPWSPPIVPQMEQILRPPDDMRNYPPPSREWDAPSRQHYYRGNRMSMADFCNRCCFFILILLAVGVVVGIVVMTSIYVSSTDCNGTPCSLLQKPEYLGGFVVLGAVAILVVFALITWCCYNATRRQRNLHKYRPRERQMYLYPARYGTDGLPP